MGRFYTVIQVEKRVGLFSRVARSWLNWNNPSDGEIERQILDVDGSCRDINMDDVDKDAACAIVDHLAELYTVERCTDARGTDLVVTVSAGEIAKSFVTCPNSLRFVFANSERVVTHLQLYLYWDDPKDVFLELTFFPSDVRLPFSLAAFKAFLDPIARLANATCYFVRYENASWTYGDVSPESGVIYVGERV